MNTIRTNLISFPIAKLAASPTVDTSSIWDISFIKKFVTTKWPFEVFKGSILQDFWKVLSSSLN